MQYHCPFSAEFLASIQKILCWQFPWFWNILKLQTIKEFLQSFVFLLTIYFPPQFACNFGQRIFSHLSVECFVMISTCRPRPGWAWQKWGRISFEIRNNSALFLLADNSRNKVLGRGYNIMFNSQVTMLPLTRTRHRVSPSTGAFRLWILTSQTLPTQTSPTPSCRVTTIGNSPSRETRRPLWSWGSLLTLSKEIHYSTWQFLLR